MEQYRTLTWTRGHLQQHVVSRGHGGGCCSCSWGDVVVVPLVSEQLVVDVVVDGEQQLRELPVLHAAQQLHHPPLHLQAGGAQLLQQLLVLGVLLPSYHSSPSPHAWSHLARGQLRQQLTEDVEVDAGDLEVLPQLGDLVLAQLAVVDHGAPLAGDLLHEASVHLLGPALALANLKVQSYEGECNVVSLRRYPHEARARGTAPRWSGSWGGGWGWTARRYLVY